MQKGNMFDSPLALLYLDVLCIHQPCSSCSAPNAYLELKYQQRFKNQSTMQTCGLQRLAVTVSWRAGPANFEVTPEAGQEILDKFRLQQGLLLTVRPDQPISLSIDQLRRLSWEEHAGVWRDYVNALAQCLVSPCTPITLAPSLTHLLAR